MSNFTEGLWTIEYSDAEKTVPVLIRADDGRVICRFVDVDTKAETLANAFLIASLPELISAAVKAHWYMCHTIREDGTCQGCVGGNAIYKAFNIDLVQPQEGVEPPSVTSKLKLSP